MKRNTMLLALLVLLALALPLTAGAESSGTCGENVTWTLNDSGVLTISGTGAMYDYAQDGAPWYGNKELVKTVQIENGVTSIGNEAFALCFNLTGVTIPDSVKSIGSGAFDGCSSVTGVTIPDSVTSIGNGAFSFCSSLENIQVESGSATYASVDGVLFDKDRTTLILCPQGKTGVYAIPSSVTSIGDDAFVYCSNLTSVTIPSSVTSIGNSAFAYCFSLTGVTIPDSVTSIGDGAFANCDSLTSVTIPNSVTSIEKDTFWGCTSLTGATIPKSVTSIGNGAFSGCTKLTHVYYTGSKKQWAKISVGSDNGPLNKAGIQYNYVEKKPKTIAKGSCGKNVTWVLNGNGLLTISGTGAMNDYDRGKAPWYSNRKTIKTVQIENGVTSIGDDTFADCSSLTGVAIPSGVTSLGVGAFFNCSSLTGVAIPDSVINIGVVAFSGCSSLERIQVGSGNTAYVSVDGILYDKDRTTLIACPGGKTEVYAIPESVKSIGEGAFYGCTSMTGVTIPDSVTSIGDMAFCGCTSLTYVIIPSSVKSIGKGAFYGCSSLINVTIPESVKSIGQKAFSDCSSLTDVYYSGSRWQWGWISIGSDNAPLKNAGIHYGYVETGSSMNARGFCGKNVAWMLDDSGLLTISGTGEMDDYNWSDARWNGNGEAIKTVQIENGVTSIGLYAFSGCHSLTSVTIPSSVTSIRGLAFSGCSSLTSVTIPSSVTSIDDMAFPYCSSLESIQVESGSTAYASVDGVLFDKDRTTLIRCPQKKAGAYAIPSGVKSIEHRAFDGCNSLTSVTIPSSVTSFSSSNPFDDCSSLENIQVESGSTTYASLDGVLFNKSRTTLISCPQGKTGAYAIPDSVTSIGYGAFFYCRGLTSVTIPSGVKSIGERAFSSCSSLTGVIIPDSVTSIGDDAFVYCSSLTSVSIPSSVTSIGGGTFSHCYSLTSVVIPSSVKSIGDNAFYACGRQTDVYYTGSSKQWAKISIGKDNEALTNTEIHYNFEVITSGSCGKKVTWTLDNVSGFLTISGKGAMDDYDWDESLWYSNREAIKTVQIENGVTSIGNYAFYGCSSLTSVTIPSSVTSIGYDVFYGCNSLESIQVESGSTTYASLDGVLFNKDRTTLIAYPGGKTGEYAIPSSVTSIGNSAFSGCSSLTGVTIPDSVTSIEDWAFNWCSGLTGVTIPKSVTRIGRAAFSDCRRLENIQVESGSKKYASVDGVLFDKDRTTLITCPGGKTGTYAIPDNVTSIGDYAFYRCESLTGVTIPSSVKSIKELAFHDCESLTDVYYTGSKKQWAKISIEEDNEDLTKAKIHFD